jgi:hypothetical protein
MTVMVSTNAAGCRSSSSRARTFDCAASPTNRGIVTSDTGTPSTGTTTVSRVRRGVTNTIWSACTERGRESIVVRFPVTACQSYYYERYSTFHRRFPVGLASLW